MEVFMKKSVLIAIWAIMVFVAAAGRIAAQDEGGPRTVSVQGTLGLQNGVIILSSGDTVYFVPHLSPYAGFIDGLKEGAQVKVEGRQMDGNYLMPSKIIVDGRDYNLSVNVMWPQPGPPRPEPPGPPPR
jgi:hypothetical protein